MSKKHKTDGEMFEAIKGSPPSRTSSSSSKYDEKLLALKEKAGVWHKLYAAPKGASKKAAHARRQSVIRAAERLGMKDKLSAQVRMEEGVQGLWVVFG